MQDFTNVQKLHQQYEELLNKTKEVTTELQNIKEKIMKMRQNEFVKNFDEDFTKEIDQNDFEEIYKEAMESYKNADELYEQFQDDMNSSFEKTEMQKREYKVMMMRYDEQAVLLANHQIFINKLKNKIMNKNSPTQKSGFDASFISLIAMFVRPEDLFNFVAVSKKVQIGVFTARKCILCSLIGKNLFRELKYFQRAESFLCNTTFLCQISATRYENDKYVSVAINELNKIQTMKLIISNKNEILSKITRPKINELILPLHYYFKNLFDKMSTLQILKIEWNVETNDEVFENLNSEISNLKTLTKVFIKAPLSIINSKFTKILLKKDILFIVCASEVDGLLLVKFDETFRENAENIRLIVRDNYVVKEIFAIIKMWNKKLENHKSCHSIKSWVLPERDVHLGVGNTENTHGKNCLWVGLNGQTEVFHTHQDMLDDNTFVKELTDGILPQSVSFYSKDKTKKSEFLIMKTTREKIGQTIEEEVPFKLCWDGLAKVSFSYLIFTNGFPEISRSVETLKLTGCVLQVRFEIPERVKVFELKNCLGVEVVTLFHHVNFFSVCNVPSFKVFVFYSQDMNAPLTKSIVLKDCSNLGPVALPFGLQDLTVIECPKFKITNARLFKFFRPSMWEALLRFF
ncbi:hypothetical protein EIN_155340 [Entamoeba invadens IP1]|uniref:Uncharacterized protein n=1 Tax=Entamoeba invadens IP1 TaxID=370355 RepID=A0A0A1U9B3_ENTIV|nr:hypothetical protein EIN_155340 [Entamoeba invadens IP1]ELP91427.1 hypothetical protein EIN_155340 [Entamoeba invadens IP1]|eukprot:XP_004258198.1 hypothetical protein EIN_155340 [Entamoeba invadens IP1]